jgi:hypothetical protein
MCNKFLIMNNPEKGVSLIITLFIMIIILSIVLSVSILLYSEVKIIRNMSNSVASYYAGESGIEKVLYYDRQVVPAGAKRGLCSMLYQSQINYCTPDIPNSLDYSIYCNNPTPFSFIGGCAVNNCTDCSISFNTTFDGRTYATVATIFPNGNFEIDSKGVFSGAQRQIQIFTPPQLNE